MLMTFYPNGELRARIPASPSKRGRGDSLYEESKVSESLILSIVENLRSDFADAPFKPEKKTSKPGYGDSPIRREFSSYAKRTVARVGGVIGQLGGRESVLFLTGTIPGGTPEAFRAVSNWSSWICHELVTHLPRLAGLLPSQCRFLWVWEWQKRGALHWHCVFESPTRELSAQVFAGFKGLWIRVLETVGRKEGIDIAKRAGDGTHAGEYKVWRTRAEWARKNPARYLAKYMGKAKTPSADESSVYPPTRWYSCSRELLRDMKSQTLTASTHAGSKIPDRVIDEEIDLGTIERLLGMSSTHRSFPDKVRDGFTFVFYIKEELMENARDLFESWKSQCGVTPRPQTHSPSRRRFPNLDQIARHRGPFERLLADIGPRDAKLYVNWIRGGWASEEDLAMLDCVAERILIWEGYKSEVKPVFPQGGLTGQEEKTLESRGSNDCSTEQLSLFP